MRKLSAMTDAQERAKMLYLKLQGWIDEPGVEMSTGDNRTIALIAAALTRVEVETWEQAAKVASDTADEHRVTCHYQQAAAVHSLAGLFGQQAQRAKEGRDVVD